MARVIEPCFLHLARQRPAEGVSPEAMASAMMLLNAEGLAKLVDSIDRQLRSGPPAVARLRIYRVALRTCIRRGAASLGRKQGSPDRPARTPTPCRTKNRWCGASLRRGSGFPATGP